MGRYHSERYIQSLHELAVELEIPDGAIWHRGILDIPNLELYTELFKSILKSSIRGEDENRIHLFDIRSYLLSICAPLLSQPRLTRKTTITGFRWDCSLIKFATKPGSKTSISERETQYQGDSARPFQQEWTEQHISLHGLTGFDTLYGHKNMLPNMHPTTTFYLTECHPWDNFLRFNIGMVLDGNGSHRGPFHGIITKTWKHKNQRIWTKENIEEKKRKRKARNLPYSSNPTLMIT